MKRFLRWLFRRTRQAVPVPVVRTTFSDLPEEYGPRMRVQEVHALFLDPRNKEMLRAMAQILWMNRVTALQKACDAAAVGAQGSGAQGNPSFHLGEIDNVSNVLADMQHFAAASLSDGTGERMDWEPTDRMKK